MRPRRYAQMVTLLAMVTLSDRLAAGQSPMPTGPFGLSMGMSEQALRAAIGDLQVEENGPFNFRATTVPTPHDSFEAYAFMVTKNQGLCELAAAGRELSMNAFGIEVRSAFKTLREALSTKYGPPTRLLDFVLPGSFWKEPQYWARGLQEKHRILQASWQFSPARPDDHLIGVIIDAKASSAETAWISLQYAFENSQQCTEERLKAKNAAF